MPSAAESTSNKSVISEDWLAVMIGAVVLAISVIAVVQWGVAGEKGVVSPLKGYLSQPVKWTDSPLASFGGSVIQVYPWLKVDPSIGGPSIAYPLIALLIAFGGGLALARENIDRFLLAFVVVFLLATFAYVLSEQAVVKYYGLEYALWALLSGMAISNTVGTPVFLKPAVRTELYMKVGLVLLGAEILLGNLLQLGLPGIFVAWIVTPIVLIITFWFGQRVLKISSPSLAMVLAADMSVCGVSAAIATAGACKAKKEELSLAIGISLSFTVIMMILMPLFIKAVGMDPVLGGAWIGGTIDATGAVGAAGAALGDNALKVATTIKMIQNILIGVIAFAVASYWVVFIEKDGERTVGLDEIWRRFPKFVIGFILASLIFSAVHEYLPNGRDIVEATISGSSKTFRGWCFCLAFVSIGLETNFRELGKYLQGGKPLVLYACGQSLNLILTLTMAWLMFYKVFPNALDVLKK